MSKIEKSGEATEPGDVPDRCFASPAAFAGLLRGMGVDALSRIVGHAGAWRVRHGKVSLCDLVVGSLRCGKDPLALFKDVA